MEDVGGEENEEAVRLKDPVNFAEDRSGIGEMFEEPEGGDNVECLCGEWDRFGEGASAQNRWGAVFEERGEVGIERSSGRDLGVNLFN